jgi:1-deoxyxylulose-5-phosphate synthase
MTWALKNPVVDAPIAGVTKQHHLSDAVAALDLQLTDDEIAALEEPYVLRQATWF